MAKRHASLVPLSQDHHHGLALALRLRQGNDALLIDGWTHDRIEQARRVQEFYFAELRIHFQAEEEILFPAMRLEIPDAGSLVAKLLSQHRKIEELVKRIAACNDGSDGVFYELGVLLEQHIRLEERELFPMYEAQIDLAKADELGKRIAAMHAL